MRMLGAQRSDWLAPALPRQHGANTPWIAGSLPHPVTLPGAGRSSLGPGFLDKKDVELLEREKTMDKGEENAASEEKAHILTENGRSSTDEYLPELEKKEKGSVPALFACVRVFPEGFDSILSILETEYVIKNIQWTTGNSFTVERGQQQIEELISTWGVHESWLHWSEFLQEEELKDSKRYHYRVCWSIPTRRKPIPRATASIYFIIEISKIKPATLPVEVFFTLESSRLIHRPEQCQFREKWLKDIIENKIILMERQTF
ncbi:A-kinase anchor protein 14 [Sarcoramphus papa]